MERFQRTKYVNQVASLRRELGHWVNIYENMLAGGGEGPFTDLQLAVAEARAEWLPEVVDQLADIEEKLAGAFGET
jgi:hypothetical protein